jgi:hypothetical protein
MTNYSISDPDRPWVMLFSSPSLDALAEAIVAQPNVAPAALFASLDGKPRSLTAAEQVRLYERVLESRPDDRVASACLAIARRDLAAESDLAPASPDTQP